MPKAASPEHHLPGYVVFSSKQQPQNKYLIAELDLSALSYPYYTIQPLMTILKQQYTLTQLCFCQTWSGTFQTLLIKWQI